MQIEPGFNFKIEQLKAKRCGCYVVHPEILNLQNKTVMVPLRHIDYDIKIVNSLAQITLIQKYVNSSDKLLQLQYNFPVDPKSCIYRFVAEFGTTKVQGIVKEKEEAKKEYSEAMKQGKYAAYGEIDDKSGDIMNMKIGNVPEQTEVTVTISILQQLQLSLNTFYLLHIVSTISPRYLNDMIQGLEKNKENKKLSGKADFTWNFKIELKTQKNVIFFDSPTHNINLLSKNESGTETIVVMSKQCIPNKDFKFYFTTEDFQVPSYVLGKTDNSSTVMLSFIPKFCTLSIDDAYKASVHGKKVETEIQNAKGQYIFVLDRSGSMSGNRIKKAQQALVLFLKSLPNDSFFDIVSFGSNFQEMFGSSKKYSDEYIDLAIKKVEKMSADLGGTQIEQPLQRILSKEVIAGYPRHVFLLTDGGVSNTNRVIDLVQKNIKYSRVHSIGIGNGASSALIVGCAQKGKGNHVFIDDNENPSQKIIGLLLDSLSAVISQVSLKFDSEIIQSIVPNPKQIPYILKNQIINFYITFKGQINKQCQFLFEYTDSQNKLPYAAKIIVSPDSESEPFVDKMAHSKIIKNLQKAHKSGIKIEDMMYYVKINDYKSEAIKQSLKSQILSEFTAFICVGKQLIDGQYQEFKSKQIEVIKIQQPVPIQSQQHQILLCSSSMAPQIKSIQRSMAPKMMMQDLNSKIFEHVERCQKLEDVQIKSLKLQNQSINFSQASKSIKPSGGIMSSIGSFFSNLVSKKQKIEQPPLQNSQKISFEDQCDQNEDENQVLQQKFKKSKKKLNLKGEISQSIQKKQTNLSVEQIVKMQKSQGSWDNQRLFQLFQPHLQKIKQICGLLTQKIVLTYLVAKWIQKNYPQKQYTLLTKKAFTWVTKEIQTKGLDQNNLKQIDLFI